MTLLEQAWHEINSLGTFVEQDACLAIIEKLGGMDPGQCRSWRMARSSWSSPLNRPLRDRKEAAFDLALAALRRIVKVGSYRDAVIADVALQHISPRDRGEPAFNLAVAALCRIAKEGSYRDAVIAVLQNISVLTGKDELDAPPR